MAGIILLVMVLFAGSAGAATNISSCQDISSPGEYVLNTNLTSSHTCIDITSSDVILDGAGHTINGPVSSSGDFGVYLVPISNVTVKNLSVTNWDTGIYLSSVSNSILTGNTASSNNFAGIYLDSSSDNTLTGNTASSNTNYGIYLASSSHNNILTSNNASSNNDGIYFDSSSNNNLTGNTASSNGVDGIYLGSSSNNNLTGNTASSNGAVGIDLASSSNNNLTGNTASSNSFGIYLYSNSNNNLTGNNASSNGYGIYLYSSGGNTFTCNNASNNTLWTFWSQSNSINNTVTNLTINPTISFTGKDVAIKSNSSPASDPAGYKNIGIFINATNNSADSWLFLNVSYSNSDVTGLNESTLRMWRYNGSWSLVPYPNNVDTGQNYVYANITAFSIFAPMGASSGVPVPATSMAGVFALIGMLVVAAVLSLKKKRGS